MQTTNNILLIKPSNFVFNVETAVTNPFQIKLNENEQAIKQKVFSEFESFVQTLKNKGLNVYVFDDTAQPVKPDAIFPNNWVSFHENGTAILYPMCAPNRRHERRPDIIEDLKKNFNISNIVDLSHHEKECNFLEGTGSIVFDHVHKIAYACISPRTNKKLFAEVCGLLNYQPVPFYAYDRNHQEIYHTNVMMCVGETFAVVCSESISDTQEREKVVQSLLSTGHELIEISFEQMNNFAGNILTLRTNTKTLLVLSQRAFDYLTVPQKEKLERYGELVPLNIKTIETIGGGSARCMMAEIFCSLKSSIGA